MTTKTEVRSRYYVEGPDSNERGRFRIVDREIGLILAWTSNRVFANTIVRALIERESK